ncbi:MAG: MBL fold metallo-hydrolase [Zestosphaera sp.]
MLETLTDRVYLVDSEPLGSRGWLSTYLIAGDDAVAVVDPGPKVVYKDVLRGLRGIGADRRAVYVVLTHVHMDHAGCVGDLVRELKRPTVVVHPRGVRHLVNPTKLWQSSLEVLGDLAQAFGKPEPVEEGFVLPAVDGGTISLGGVDLEAIHTPGHAQHHVSYLLKPHLILFAGDSIANYFSGRAYPVTVPPFNASEYLRSLSNMLALRPRKVAVSHYGVVDVDPDILIQRVKDKLTAWIYRIEKLLSEGCRDPRVVYETILREDVELSYARDLEEGMPAFRGATYRAILGLYNYLTATR